MVLIFSCSLDTLYLGLAIKNNIINKKEIKSKQKHSELMIASINEFLKENNTSLAKIKKLYFTNGPGGFTGIRLGVIFAKTQNILNGAKLCVIDTLSSIISDQSGWVSIEAKSEKYYSGKFKDGKLVSQILLTNENKATFKPNYNVVENMLNKIKYAKCYDNFNQIEINYIKKL